jgi:chromosome segregation ATPase
LTAEVHDLKRQLTAARADIDLARADTERVMTANANLQHALEAFQSERDAELALLEDQRRDMEEAMAAAHAAALEATHEAHEADIRRIRLGANEEVAKVRMEVKKMEEKNDILKADNVQMRRSLDEAIQRLQSTQEDIIDRTIMKNILLDWLSKPAAKERRQVLEVMANLLHFTTEEKEKVHLVDEGAFGKIVHSVAQLPPPKADVEQLKRENVREKWVNFLLSEIED